MLPPCYSTSVKKADQLLFLILIDMHSEVFALKPLLDLWIHVGWAGRNLKGSRGILWSRSTGPPRDSGDTNIVFALFVDHSLKDSRIF